VETKINIKKSLPDTSRLVSVHTSVDGRMEVGVLENELEELYQTTEVNVVVLSSDGQ
jgi:hypothetical protein